MKKLFPFTLFSLLFLCCAVVSAAETKIFTPESVAALYNKNSLDADKRLAGTIITLQGVMGGSVMELPIRFAHEDAFILDMVEKNAPKDFMGNRISPKILCTFTPDQEAALRKLKSEQVITVTGKVNPLSGKPLPALSGCKIVKVQ